MSDYNEYYKKAWEMNLAKQTEQIATLEAKLAKAREALEFYSSDGYGRYAQEVLKEIGE